MSEDLKVFGKTYTGVTGIQAKNTGGDIVVYVSGARNNDFVDYIERNTNSFTNSEITSISNGVMRAGSPNFTIDFPNCTTVGNEAFRNAWITNANLPNVEYLGTSAFRESRLTYVVLPRLARISTSAFESMNVNLLKIDLGAKVDSVLDIQQWTFYGTSKCTDIVLRYNGVCPLLSTNAFTGSLFDSGKAGGTLYVPQAFISSYQSETNWSTVLGRTNNSIQAIEGSQYENYYVDGTPIS